MEEETGKEKKPLHKHIKKLIVELDKIDGKKLRHVSSTDKNGIKPSLTITAEISDLKWKKGDWVYVGVENNKIVIERVPIK